MVKSSSLRHNIRLRGVRHNNLKNFDLELPLNQLIVITGLSGSGKSSLAFDTLFAEGQRRYIETFSPYARQFLDRMDKPQVDQIEGIPPAIAVEQRNAVRTTRSTVGTMTELCDYLKMLWPHVARLHCRGCGHPVIKDSPQSVWQTVSEASPSGEVVISFDLPLSEKLGLDESLALVERQGYRRLLHDGRMIRIEDLSRTTAPARLTVVQDRLELAPRNRARFTEACEQAYHFGKGTLAIWSCNSAGEWSDQKRFSCRLHCASCDIEYREPSPALFSFNHPVGACPNCRGFGRIISIDYALAIPDRSKSPAEGLVKPWQTGQGAECQADLLRMCRKHRVPTDIPFHDMSAEHQDFVINGEPDYGKDAAHEWPNAWYGVKGYFRWLESKAYKMHVRVLLSRYRAYTPCPACQGKRFQPEALLYRAGLNGQSLTLADFYQLPIRDALPFLKTLLPVRSSKRNDPLQLVLNEAASRLEFLDQVGLGYLTLDRPTRTLSGGETERVSLTTCLGARLVNTLFVLDEPSVGLHPRDTDRLIRILKRLRDAGNTVVVVEHEAAMMRAADQLIDLGPGHGATGGQVVFQGSYSGILRSPSSLTGQYLSGGRRIEIPARRPFRPNVDPVLTISRATCHNLRDLTTQIPLTRLVCVTGVSGSGKSTLIRDILLPTLSARFSGQASPVKASDRLDSSPGADDGQKQGPEDQEEISCEQARSASLSGAEHLESVVLVDQSILAKTPRSNPGVYIGAFDFIREFFAQTDFARRRGLGASAFSFNSSQGQCERCRGAGFEKIEMQFLSDVFVRCPECNGRRYRSHILEVKVAGSGTGQGWSIADLLEQTVEEVMAFLEAFPDSKPAARAVQALRWLSDVGLGYLKLGQPINTLSGGESQRLKLVRYLADAGTLSAAAEPSGSGRGLVRPGILFLFDEPTTGLHFEDVRILLGVFHRLVDAGHSVIVIEHNLDVIKSADWIIDLGPEAGDRGGRIVVSDTPELVAACPESHTGQALRALLPSIRKSRAAARSLAQPA